VKKVTRDIDPVQAQDLLERVPRACLAFAGADGPQLYPVDLAFQEGRYRVRLPIPVQDLTSAEAVLLVDDGIYYFDLRAVYIRGELRLEGSDWFELIPSKTVAWDYGTLRVVEY
jgi:hypothetical protein